MPHVAVVLIIETDADTPDAADAAWERITATMPDDVAFVGNPWAVEPYGQDDGAPVFDTDDAMNQRRIPA